MTPKLFSELGLSPEILKAIDQLGFEKASPIQAEAIPILLQSRDIVGQSQTGSGKTAAFGIPVIEKIDITQRHIQALILCPTRELAVQVSEDIHKLAAFKRGVAALPIYGGQSYERQFWGLKQGPQIIIGTPGRVMDHMRRGTLRLQSVRLVVLDEADVMLNMGFREDMETILQAIPTTRQTVFFSATMPRPIRELIEKYARSPHNVKIEQKALTVPTVEQVYYEVDRRQKIDLLTRLIDLHDLKLGIIFCNTKRMVDDLVDHLEAQGYLADRLHGDMSQGMRDRVMQKFRKSGLEFLVATDIAARGIDVDDIQVVFNYDLPYDGEDYVHRIGRTGRAGKHGRAISFASGRELFQIRNIERYTNVRIHRAKIPTAAEVEEAKAGQFLDRLRATLQSGHYTKHENLVGRLLEEGFDSTDIISALIHQLQDGEEQPQSSPARIVAPPNPSVPQQKIAPEPRIQSPPPVAPPPRPAVKHPTPTPAKQALPVIPQPAKLAPITATLPAPPFPRTASATPSAPPKSKSPPPTKPAAPISPPAPAETPTTPRRHSRATPPEFTRLYINLGAEHGIESNDIRTTIMGETGLPATVVGTIDVRERHLFVDVAVDSASTIISRLNRSQIKGRKVKIKAA